MSGAGCEERASVAQEVKRHSLEGKANVPENQGTRMLDTQAWGRLARGSRRCGGVVGRLLGLRLRPICLCKAICRKARVEEEEETETVKELCLKV